MALPVSNAALIIAQAGLIMAQSCSGGQCSISQKKPKPISKPQPKEEEYIPKHAYPEDIKINQVSM